MSTTELRRRVLEQGLAAVNRIDEERRNLPEPDFEYLAAAATSSMLACCALRTLDVLARHHPDIATRLAEELLDLDDDRQEIEDYIRSQSRATGITLEGRQCPAPASDIPAAA